jgi:hypothetical protein
MAPHESVAPLLARPSARIARPKLQYSLSAAVYAARSDDRRAASCLTSSSRYIFGRARIHVGETMPHCPLRTRRHASRPPPSVRLARLGLLLAAFSRRGRMGTDTTRETRKTIALACGCSGRIHAKGIQEHDLWCRQRWVIRAR